MTAAQQKSIGAIIGKIETLQKKIGASATREEAEALRAAKEALFRIYF